MEGAAHFAFGEQDLAVSGLRDAVMRQRGEGGGGGSVRPRAAGEGGRGVADTFELLRAEAEEEAGQRQGSGGAAGGVLCKIRRFLTSHPRSVLLFLACAVLFAVLARIWGDLPLLETAGGAVVAGLAGAVLERRVFGQGRPTTAR
jgi:hypothetical protein